MNVTEAFNQRNFLIQRSDFTTESHKDLIKAILKKHGEEDQNILEIKIIDDNEDYDSFFVKTVNTSLCIKISFDDVPIYYEHLILRGIANLSISPIAYERNEIFWGKNIYYTISSFEFSNNLHTLGINSILLPEYNNFNENLKKLHSVELPDELLPYLDDMESYLNYQKINFDNILKYVEMKEVKDYEYMKKLYLEIHEETMNLYEANKSKIVLKNLVHGKLDSKTIIENSGYFKFLNFENAFVGSCLFDIASLVLELNMNNLKEFDFVTNKINSLQFTEKKFRSQKLIDEYKICKSFLIRKKMLDVIRDYIKEIIIYNSERIDKIVKISNDFSKHFYRFCNIDAVNRNKDGLVNKLITNQMKD